MRVLSFVLISIVTISVAVSVGLRLSSEATLADVEDAQERRYTKARATIIF